MLKEYLADVPMLQGPLGLTYTAVQVMIVLSSYGEEKKEAAQYSKFAQTTVEQKQKLHEDQKNGGNAKPKEAEEGRTGALVPPKLVCSLSTVPHSWHVCLSCSSNNGSHLQGS